MFGVSSDLFDLFRGSDKFDDKVETGLRSFVQAAQSGDLDTVKALFESGGIDVDARMDSINALHAAVISQHHNIVEWLLNHGANVHDCNPASGRTVLHNA